MLLDYRFYIRFRDRQSFDKWMKTIEMETTDGEVFSLQEISEVFSSPEGMRHLMEPIGEIFDTVTTAKDGTFCFIHDHRKSEHFFERLTYYLFEEAIAIAEDDMVLIADLTDYDWDGMGDIITWYLGGGKEQLNRSSVEEYEGLEHHGTEISDFSAMLKHETLTDAQRQHLNRVTGND